MLSQSQAASLAKNVAPHLRLAQPLVLFSLKRDAGCREACTDHREVGLPQRAERMTGKEGREPFSRQ